MMFSVTEMFPSVFSLDHSWNAMRFGRVLASFSPRYSMRYDRRTNKFITPSDFSRVHRFPEFLRFLMGWFIFWTTTGNTWRYEVFTMHKNRRWWPLANNERIDSHWLFTYSLLRLVTRSQRSWFSIFIDTIGDLSFLILFFVLSVTFRAAEKSKFCFGVPWRRPRFDSVTWAEPAWPMGKRQWPTHFASLSVVAFASFSFLSRCFFSKISLNASYALSLHHWSLIPSFAVVLCVCPP